MLSSPNHSGFTQQVEAIRQHLMSIRDRLSAEFTSAESTIETEIDQALLSAIGVLESARSVIQQAEENLTIEQLRAAVQEKDVLLREVHHRIKNNLQVVNSFLDLQMLRTEDTSVQALLRSNQSRIRSIALVHDKLSQSSVGNRIRLCEYIRSLATTLVQSYAIAPTHATLRTTISGEIELSSNQVVPIGLILNELISNAILHGLANQPGEIAVSLYIENLQVTLTVGDTGNQFPANLNLNTPQTLGFQIINSLVQQLNASLSIDRIPQTTISLQFAAANLE